jgi:hypothetical protein
MKLKPADAAEYGFLIWVVGFEAVTDERGLRDRRVVLGIEVAPHEE